MARMAVMGFFTRARRCDQVATALPRFSSSPLIRLSVGELPTSSRLLVSPDRIVPRLHHPVRAAMSAVRSCLARTDRHPPRRCRDPPTRGRHQLSQEAGGRERAENPREASGSRRLRMPPRLERWQTFAPITPHGSVHSQPRQLTESVPRTSRTRPDGGHHHRPGGTEPILPVAAFRGG